MNNRVEFVLALIGTILSTIGWTLSILYIISFAAITRPANPSIGNFLVVIALSELPFVVFNWAATFRLKYKPVGWAIYLIVSGCLLVFSPMILFAPLLITAGAISYCHKK